MTRIAMALALIAGGACMKIEDTMRGRNSPDRTMPATNTVPMPTTKPAIPDIEFDESLYGPEHLNPRHIRWRAQASHA